MVLLITGCIAPKETYALQLIDPEERLKQYIRSILFYIKESPIDKIIFCENSNYNYNYKKIIEFAAKKRKELEILTFEGNREMTKLRGKGYGEGEIIDYALIHSKLMRKEQYFYKVTGRLIVRNIARLIKKNKDGNNYFNKNFYAYHSLDTRFWGMNKKDYLNKLVHSYHNVNDRSGYYLEHVFLQDLCNTKFRCHRTMPVIIGISGTLGIQYDKFPKWLFNIMCANCSLNLFNCKFIFKIEYILFNRFVRLKSLTSIFKQIW